MKENQIEIVKKIVDGMIGIGGIPTNVEFYSEFDMRLRAALELPVDNITNYLLENEKYEPYFGWCDVKGCKNEGSCGGICWKDTAYWTTCSEHSANNRAGAKQPKMKQSAIDREKRRDKKTGYLTDTKQQ